MARLGRSFPVRPLTARQPYRRDAGITLGPFEIEAEFPALSVVTPDARVLLPAFEIAAEFPPLTLSYGQRPTLPAFEIEAEFPPLTVTIPVKPGDSMSGVDGQIEWNGFLLGSATPYRWLNLVGWRDRPGIDTGNVPRPSRHGSWAGRPLAQERVITWTARIKTPRDQLEAVLSALDAATPIPDDDTEFPLVIRDFGTPYLVYGRIDRLSLPIDKILRLGVGNLVIQWVSSDPRRYSLERRGATIPLSTPTALANVGNAATHPLIRLEGPLTNPVLTHQTLDRILQFAITLTAGQLLEIDTDAGTVTQGGVSKMATLTGASVPVQDFVLAAGSNTIMYTATSGGAEGADFLWRNATI